MQTSDLRQRVRSELVEFAWSQWAQMGLSGAVTRRDRWAVDPEALLLFTLHVARHDPRLFDEVLDWLRKNGRLISVQRLRNLARSDSASRRLANVALSWAGRNNPSLHGWASQDAVTVEGEMEQLFLADGEGIFSGRADDVFRAHGFLRPPAEASLKSQEPDFGATVNFAFRLRLLFGLGTRSEVARFLLSTEHPEAATQQIAEATAFAKRNVSETLVALAEARLLEIRWRGNERVYRMDPKRWTSLLGIGLRDLPVFAAWIPLFGALRAIQMWLEEDAALDRSDYLRASDARQLMDRVQPDLLAAGVDVPDERGVHGTAYWGVFEETLEETLRMLRAPT